MARDASGTHSLPAGNPVVTGTTISSTVHNNTISDLSDEITNSLDRTGKGAMQAQFKSTDGSVSAPGTSFSSELGSGFYRAGAGDVRWAILGSDIVKTTATGLTITATLSLSVDTISESTSANGVVIDSVTLKDGGVTAAGTSTFAGGTITDLGTVTAADITTLSIGGVAVTSTAAELNILDGVTSTAAELNILDGVTSTAAELNILDGVTATAAELNYLDITTLGTAAASKALTVSAGSAVVCTGITFTDLGTVTTVDINGGTIDGTNIGASSAGTGNFSTLSIGGVAITSTAAELNILDGVTATAAELNYLDITTLGTAAASKALTVSAGSAVVCTGITFTDLGTVTTVDINGGTIDGATINNSAIGGSTPAAGAFTTLSASGKASFSAEIGETTGTMPAGTTPSIDPTNGTIQVWTLSGNSTPTSSIADGEFVTLYIDDGTAYTIDWATSGAVDVWKSGSAPTLDTTNKTVVTLNNVDGTVYGQLNGVYS